MRSVVLGTALFCGLFLSAPASAQLAIDKLWVDFEPGAADRADVVVRNESADRYYITVTPSEITDPGAADEKRVAMTDPEKLGVLVTPNRLVVDPGGVRSIRIVSLNTGLTKDRVYRVRIAPQIGDLQAGDPGAANRGLSIKLLAAYDLLVTVRPKGGKPDLVVTRTPTQLVIRNQGNSNTLLFDGMACSEGQKPDVRDTKSVAKGAAQGCDKIPSKRLYAGTEWTVPLTKADAKVRFKERALSSSQPKDLVF